MCAVPAGASVLILADYVRFTRPTGGATAAGGSECCLRSEEGREQGRNVARWVYGHAPSARQ